MSLMLLLDYRETIVENQKGCRVAALRRYVNWQDRGTDGKVVLEQKNKLMI
ncbi:hypothetical protein AB4Z50_34760 [Paenibacillus sp. 2TAB26]|uniref:hypothetical protein n=1 Tax=Paenibacillus sp. 2TAB26 TaxID=3233005 RepID=UPI003F98F051